MPGSWDYTMTKRGSALWDKVAEENFHKLLSIDFDGEVVSTPSSSRLSPLSPLSTAEGEISGNLTKAEAMALVQALHHADRLS